MLIRLILCYNPIRTYVPPYLHTYVHSYIHTHVLTHRSSSWIKIQYDWIYKFRWINYHILFVAHTIPRHKLRTTIVKLIFVSHKMFPASTNVQKCVLTQRSLRYWARSPAGNLGVLSDVQGKRECQKTDWLSLRDCVSCISTPFALHHNIVYLRSRHLTCSV